MKKLVIISVIILILEILLYIFFQFQNGILKTDLNISSQKLFDLRTPISPLLGWKSEYNQTIRTHKDELIRIADWLDFDSLEVDGFKLVDEFLKYNSKDLVYYNRNTKWDSLTKKQINTLEINNEFELYKKYKICSELWCKYSGTKLDIIDAWAIYQESIKITDSVYSLIYLTGLEFDLFDKLRLNCIGKLIDKSELNCQYEYVILSKLYDRNYFYCRDLMNQKVKLLCQSKLKEIASNISLKN